MTALATAENDVDEKGGNDKESADVKEAAAAVTLPKWALNPLQKSKWLASDILIPYARGCDLSCTYSDVTVHDRTQHWAYGDVF